MGNLELQGKTVKLHFSLITSPNAMGIVTRETPKTITVKVTERTFEQKTNDTFPKSRWSKDQIEWWKGCVGFELKFWKDTMMEFGAVKNWKHWSIKL